MPIHTYKVYKIKFLNEKFLPTQRVFSHMCPILHSLSISHSGTSLSAEKRRTWRMEHEEQEHDLSLHDYFYIKYSTINI